MKQFTFKTPLTSKGIWTMVISLLIILILLQLLTFFGQTSYGLPLSQSMFFTLLTYLLVMLTPIFAFEKWILKPEGEFLRFNFKTPKQISWLLFFVLMTGAMFISEFFTVLVPTEGGWLGEMYQLLEQQIIFLTNDAVAIVIMTVIFAPLLEEILFRGIILRGLLNRGMKPALAIFVSALAFGGFHFNPWQFVAGLLLGLVLGYAYWKTGSLSVAILLHAFNNLISAILILSGKTENFAETFGVGQLLLLLIGILLAAISFYLLQRSKFTSGR